MVDGHSNWIREEKSFLKKHYGNLPTKEIAARLGRSVSAVRAAVVQLDPGTCQRYSGRVNKGVLILVDFRRGAYGVPCRNRIYKHFDDLTEFYLIVP